MNILFVLYHDLSCNSALHVQALASEFERRGHVCAIQIPGAPVPQVDTLDWIVAWTPRENVRKMVAKIHKLHPRARLAIHLEDNEAAITARYLGIPVSALPSIRLWNPLAWRKLRALRGLPLSHPARYRRFLSEADAVTMVAPELAAFVPDGIRSASFNPGFDEALFGIPMPEQAEARRAFDLPDGCAVLSYTGNIHYGNADDMASLYECVRLLNARGVPTFLLRTGENHVGDAFSRRVAGAIPHVRELGLLPRERLPAVLAAADVLVQPGTAGDFNDYRFPSKLPEFLASGRPVVMGRTNLGRRISPEAAVVLDDMSPAAMADAVARLLAHQDEARRIGMAGKDYAFRHLRWKQAADIVEELLSTPREQAH